MRLELEQNHLQAAFPSHIEMDVSAEDRAGRAAEHLRIGIKAAQLGNRAAARISLLQATELDPRNESAWLWLSSISEYPEELLAFLTNVLEINPQNAKALEWSAATRSLLARNFIQRGIDAAESNQFETAAQHFNQALEYDERNSLAWLWLASLAESNEGKLTYFEKALEFDPENETAQAGLERARNDIRQGLLNEARSAAVAGDSEQANQLIDAIIAEEPNAEDAWMLRSHLCPHFEGKAAALRRVLEINPNNTGAKASLDSLNSILGAVFADRTVLSTDNPEEPFMGAFDETPGNDGPDEQMIVDDSAFGPEAAATEPVALEEFTNVSETPFAEEFLSNEIGMGDFDDPVDFEQSDTSFDAAESSFDRTFFAREEDTDRQEFISEPGTSNAAAGDEELPEVIEYELSPQEEAFPQAGPSSNVVFLHPQASDEAQSEPAAIQPESSFNPFHSVEFRNEDDGFKTLVSFELDSEAANVVLNDDIPSPAPEAFEAQFNSPLTSEPAIANEIPMPERGLEQLPPSTTGFETYVVDPAKELDEVTAVSTCPFCRAENDAQAISCHGCFSVLTLADLELVLANANADKAVVRRAVAEMERGRLSREYSENELTLLGLGHLNLRNFQFGYNYLLEASQKNRNNVVLAGQVNALLIRLDEIRQQEEAHGSMVSGKTILVVDDSPTVRKLIAGKLEKSGHQVHCCSDGIEAMDRLAVLKPDLVLLDINMPRMDGYQVCKLIRSDQATKDVPVVMISGKDGFFDKVRGRMAGTSGYITKPFGPETLMKAVESYLNPTE